MENYLIRHRQIYDRDYIVRANSYEEAEEKLQDAINNKKFRRPRKSSMSYFTDLTDRCDLDKLNASKKVDVE